MNLFELIYADDAGSLICLVAILFIVGTNMADPSVRRWGWRAAAAAYVAFVVYAIAAVGPTRAAELAYIAYRALFAGGLGVGTTWILLAVAMFFVRELREAEATLVTARDDPPQKTVALPPDICRDDRMTDWQPKLRDFSKLPPEAWQEFQNARHRGERYEQEARALLARLRQPAHRPDPSVAERRLLQTQLDELALARQFFTDSGDDPQQVGRVLAECDARMAALQVALGQVKSGTQDKPPELAGVTVIDEAIARRPHNPALHVERAKFFVGHGSYRDAVRDCQRALKLLPTYWAAFNLRGCAYHQLKKYAAAVREFERAIYENPSCGSAYVNLAATYNATGAHREAIGPASYVSETNPKGHHHLAAAYEQLGEPEPAVHHLSLLIQSDPSGERFPDARVRRARQLLKLGRTELAIHDLKTQLARRSDPSARALLVELERIAALDRQKAEATSREEEEAGELGELDVEKV